MNLKKMEQHRKKMRLQKAKFYGQYFEVVICNDSGLYFEELALDDVRQPGLNVRTPMQMDRLSDEEMIDKASSKRFEGWPLDSLSMNKETGKYFVDGSMEESKENIIKDEYEKRDCRFFDEVFAYCMKLTSPSIHVYNTKDINIRRKQIS